MMYSFNGFTQKANRALNLAVEARRTSAILISGRSISCSGCLRRARALQAPRFPEAELQPTPLKT